MNLHILLLSSSRPTYGADLFNHALPHLEKMLEEVERLLFIPYAAPGGASHESYTQSIRDAFEKIGFDQQVTGIEEYSDPRKAILEAEAIFTGGGNTFLLLKTLYDKGLIDPLRKKIENGIPYMGSSAGSNIAGLTINTSNDMAIVHPPSLDALGWLPFNINPHYPLKEDVKHGGEKRADRIREFHALPQNTQPVIAPYESSMLYLKGNSLKLLGDAASSHPAAWLFRQGEPDPVPLLADSDIGFLLKTS